MNSDALLFKYPTYLILSFTHTYPAAATVPVKLYIVHTCTSIRSTLSRGLYKQACSDETRKKRWVLQACLVIVLYEMLDNNEF